MASNDVAADEQKYCQWVIRMDRDTGLEEECERPADAPDFEGRATCARCYREATENTDVDSSIPEYPDGDTL